VNWISIIPIRILFSLVVVVLAAISRTQHAKNTTSLFMSHSSLIKLRKLFYSLVPLSSLFIATEVTTRFILL